MLVLDDGLRLIQQRLAGDHHLAVLVTNRPGRDEPDVAVVNAAVIDHPVTGERVLAFVARPGIKLSNLRRLRHATLVARAGWEWAAASGSVELAGPDDLDVDLDGESRRALLRQIYSSAGGRHPDLDAYDDVMRTERRCAVLLHPSRIWSNPAGSEHREPEDTP